MSNVLVEPFFYIPVPDAIRHIPRSTLPPAAKLLWCTILDIQGQNDHAWPGQKYLAFKAGLSVSEVGKWIKKLKELGLLEVWKKGRGYCYRCHLPLELVEASHEVKSKCHVRGQRFNLKAATAIRDEAMRVWKVRLLHEKQGSVRCTEHSSLQTAALAAPNNEVPCNDRGCSADRSEPLQLTTAPPTTENHSMVAGGYAPSSPTVSCVQADSKPRRSQRSKHQPELDLTDDEKKFILSSPEIVKLYLNCGADEVRQHLGKKLLNDVNNLTANVPFDRNGSWTQHTVWGRDAEGNETHDLRAGRWNKHQLAHWYWWQVCQIRTAAGQALDMPFWDKRRKKRLYADVTSLLNSGTREQAFNTIVLILKHFDYIQLRLGRFGASLRLDETTLGIPRVRGIADEMSPWTPEQIDRAYAEMNRARDRAA